MERVKTLAGQAMALHREKPATGEDLHRLAEICLDADRFEEAAALASKYVEAAGKGPAPSLGYAHAVKVRALAKSGKIAEADAALEAWEAAMPGAEGIPTVARTVADALVAAGRPEEALPRYRESHDRLPRPLKPGAGAVVQSLAETLVALGRPEEARKVLEKALKDSGGNANLLPRLQAVLRRVDMAGKPFPMPALERWPGGAAPDGPALRGKVVVWHFFAWWMDSRSDDLADWAGLLPSLSGKGLLLLPVTRTAGWDPKASKFDPEARKPEAECADIEATVRGRGWKGPFGISFEGAAFTALSIRGLPMEVVVGRDGKVLFSQAGSEAGHDLARWVARRAAEGEAPPAREEPPPGPR
jgi:tetratricopeptide (TPR) repeat protein